MDHAQFLRALLEVEENLQEEEDLQEEEEVEEMVVSADPVYFYTKSRLEYSVCSCTLPGPRRQSVSL